jgi:hypothetical protein
VSLFTIFGPGVNIFFSGLDVNSGEALA